MFLKHFPKHLLVTPLDGVEDKTGWNKLNRELPDPQEVGRAVYFTPNGFDSLSRGESDVTQFNSIYIDIDCPKGSTPDEIDSLVKKRVGEVFTTLEPSFIVRTKNGIHCHWLLTEPLQVTDESKSNYMYVLDSMVNHFNADVGAKGINRVLRVPGFKHYKDIDDPYDVHLIHESPETTYTLDEIADAIDIEYPQPVDNSEVTVVGSAGEFGGDIDVIMGKMLKRENSRRVYEGDISDYNDNTSSADLALCNHLAFWFGKDREVMRSVWLASPLGQREKTQKRVDYQDRTLDEAIANCENVYEPILPVKKQEVAKELDMKTLHYKIVKEEKRYNCSLYNAMQIIDNYNICKYDEFKCRYFIFENGEWRDRTDESDLRIYYRMAHEYPFMEGLSKTNVMNALTKAGMDNRYDSAKLYCESLEWDGESRIDHWLHKVFGVADDDYHTDVGSNWFKGMVGRMVYPGSKFDGALIIKGGQRMGKSKAFLDLCAGFSDGINSVEFTDGKDRQLVEDIQGKIIAEFSEGAVFTKADQKTIKSVITKQYDRMRIPYETHARDFPRRCVFAVTTNEDGFLKDDTGNRRWWAVDCGDFQHLKDSERPKADNDWLIEHRDQLFAEAYHRVVNLKETNYELDYDELERRQTPFEDTFDDEDLYMSAYNSMTEHTKRAGVTVRMVYNKAFPSDNEAHISKSIQMAIASILRNPKKLGLQKLHMSDTNYWFPRNALANFEVGITEEEAQKRREEEIKQQNNY